MRLALVNPAWTFEGSIYFGCREPHLPLELGYTAALLEAAGHSVLVADAQLGVAFLLGPGSEGSDARELHETELHDLLGDFRPDATVLPTAPSYLFWRCAPPELRVPIRAAAALRDVAGALIVVGPHASTTPRATLRKLRADLAVLGECEDVILRLAERPRDRWSEVACTARLEDEDIVYGGPEGRRALGATDLRLLPALRWPREALARHHHHHHRFEAPAAGPGAEIEASRGCPYHCTFCAKQNFRDSYRKRPREVVLAELDRLVESGARYVYFIDEIFLPDRALLEAVAERRISFGVQLRIDNWTPEMLELLGRAGCVSIEGGIESITEHGRSLLAKRCHLTTEELTDLFILAKKHVPFVQANLLDAQTDDVKEVAAWREHLRGVGVWANDPVPLFPYPGSPEFGLRFGACDDDAWERAHASYVEAQRAFSDLQDQAPRPLRELEATR